MTNLAAHTANAFISSNKLVTPITRVEWLRRCSDRLCSNGVDLDSSLDLCVRLFCQLDTDYMDTPEFAADELLAYAAVDPIVAKASPSKVQWPSPTPHQMNDPRFTAIWNAIKSWNISVPEAYPGHTEATHNHVVRIMRNLDLIYRGKD